MRQINLLLDGWDGDGIDRQTDRYIDKKIDRQIDRIGQDRIGQIQWLIELVGWLIDLIDWMDGWDGWID